MKTKIAFCLLLFVVFLAFIDIKPTKQSFGFYACECSDSCAVVYEVTPNHLTLEYPTNFCSFSENQAALVPPKTINNNDAGQFLINVPLLMFFEPRGSFGYPDSADQGGYYFSFEFLGLTRSFIFDPNQGDEPFYSKNILEKIKQNKNEIAQKFEK